MDLIVFLDERCETLVPTTVSSVFHSCTLEAGLSGQRLTDYPGVIYLNAGKTCLYMCV